MMLQAVAAAMAAESIIDVAFWVINIPVCEFRTNSGGILDGIAKSIRLSEVQRFRIRSAKGAGAKHFMLFQELATGSGHLAESLGAARNGCLSEIGYLLRVHHSYFEKS